MSDNPTPPTPTFRPGTLDDWPAITTMLANTWDDGEYIDETLWRAWTADVSSQLTMVTLDDQVVGFARLSRLGPAEWWLEVMRIDPQQYSHEIGRALLAQVVEISQRDAIGLLRFFTNSTNEIMPQLAKEAGFLHTMSYSPMQIATQAIDYRNFKLLQPSNLELLYTHLRRSPMYRANHFAEHRNIAYYLTQERLGEYLSDPDIQVLGWRQFDQLHGIVILMPDTAQEGSNMDVAYLEAPDDTSLRAMLDALRGLAAKRNYQQVAWKVPLGVGLDRLILTTELEKRAEDELWLYELPLRH
ncbi:MAG: GNAT family N-acetyltransferase [Anaerolineae bacterium]|nr:GNAT family N-acetyltransferase [Anaerolineae bacterium]